MFAGLLSSSVKVEAGTSKTVENEKSYLFAVPEGGWSTITVYVLQYNNEKLCFSILYSTL